MGRRCARPQAFTPTVTGSRQYTAWHCDLLSLCQRASSPNDWRACWTPWSVFQDGLDGQPSTRHRIHNVPRWKPARVHQVQESRASSSSPYSPTGAGWPSANADTCWHDRLKRDRTQTRSETPTARRQLGSTRRPGGRSLTAVAYKPRKCTGSRTSKPGRVLRSPIPTHRTDHRLNSRLCLRGPICLPLSGFTHCFALSSKCFSIFPHGTCSLSDSWSYLAFDGVYHRLHLVLANKATLW